MPELHIFQLEVLACDGPGGGVSDGCGTLDIGVSSEI